MAVKETVQTEEEQRQAREDFKSKESEISDRILSNLDLSESSEEKPKKRERENLEGGEVKPKRSVTDLKEPDPDDEEEEKPRKGKSDDVDEEGEEIGEDNDDDVVPKSKYEKKVRSLREKIREQERQLRARESEEKTPSSRREKLERLSENELKNYKREAKIKAMQALKEDDKDLANQYADLEDEIDDVIRTAPQRFQSKQVAAWDRRVKEVLDDEQYEQIDFENKEVVARVKNNAAHFFSKYKLQNNVDGQAVALDMALDYELDNMGKDEDKSKNDDMRRSMNRLKRKTSLDSNPSVRQTSSTNLRNKYEKARASRSSDPKEEFLKEFIDVEQYLPPSLKGGV